MAGTDILDKIRAIHGLIKTELPIAAGVCIIAGEIISGQQATATRFHSGFLPIWYSHDN